MNALSLQSSLIVLGFEREIRRVAIVAITPLVPMRPKTKLSQKYQQILASAQTLGMVEPPVVIPMARRRGRYLLLDGQLRLEALKDLGITEVDCLIATDDEAYTYNKRISRLSAVQEHYMILRTVDRGVSIERIAQALNVKPVTIQERFRLLDGICPEVVELLADKPCPRAVFERLRQMQSLRQMQAAEMLVAQNNYTTRFADALLASTPPEQRVVSASKRSVSESDREQLARLDRELAVSLEQSQAVQVNYAADNLHLTIAKTYLRKLLGNARIVRWLAQHHGEILAEFQTIAELSTADSSTRGPRPVAVR